MANDVLKREDPVVFHFRVKSGEDNDFKATEGATVVFLPTTRHFGLSLCCAKDNFNRTIGRQIAMARAENKQRKASRFVNAAYHTGDLKIEDIRTTAIALAREGARKVGNSVATDWVKRTKK